MNSKRELEKEIGRYLKATGLAPSMFGWSVLGDYNFIRDLRNGRSPTMKTVDKVRKWMAENPPE